MVCCRWTFWSTEIVLNNFMTKNSERNCARFLTRSITLWQFAWLGSHEWVIWQLVQLNSENKRFNLLLFAWTMKLMQMLLLLDRVQTQKNRKRNVCQLLFKHNNNVFDLSDLKIYYCLILKTDLVSLSQWYSLGNEMNTPVYTSGCQWKGTVGVDNRIFLRVLGKFIDECPGNVQLRKK